MDINEKVFLLAILKKELDESINEVLLKLENSGLFSLKEGKKILKAFKKESFIENNSLTLKGELEAKKIELEFKI